jgi:hypothetical protein
LENLIVLEEQKQNGLAKREVNFGNSEMHLPARQIP